jgi:hypothetical protein
VPLQQTRYAKPIFLTPPSSCGPTKFWQEFLKTLNPLPPNENSQITEAREMAEAELAKRKKLTEQRKKRYDDPS